MRNLIIAGATAFSLATLPSFAGDLATGEDDADTIVIEPVIANANVAWLVPAIALVALAVAAGGSGSDGTTTSPTTGMVSDINLKENIVRMGTSPSGLPVYSWSYKGDSAVYMGVLAQDVLLHKPSAVSTGWHGFYQVDYSQIDVEMKRLD
jgi:hypothetical protein